jgi:hypothetical protein
MGGDKSWSRGSVMPTPEKQQMQRGGRGGGGGSDWSRGQAPPPTRNQVRNQ